MNWEERLEVRHKAYKADALRVLSEHPGPCVVKYMVLGVSHARPFPELAVAYTWIAAREQAGMQATKAIVLDDGTEYDAYSNTPLRMGRLEDDEED